jgi:hypothetical protein
MAFVLTANPKDLSSDVRFSLMSGHCAMRTQRLQCARTGHLAMSAQYHSEPKRWRALTLYFSGCRQ